MTIIINVLIWFIICPYLVGKMICLGKKDTLRNNDIFCYIIGYFGTVSIFTVLYFPVLIFDGRYSVLRNLFLIIISIICIISLIINVKRINILNSSYIKNIKIKRMDYIVLFSLIFLVVLQIFRIIKCSYVNVDDSVYIPISNDILYSNRISLIDYETGKIFDNIWIIDSKYTGASWFSMIAFYTEMFQVNTITMYKVIFPVFFLILFYLILWTISSEFFEESSTKRMIYIIINIVLMENRYNDMVFWNGGWGKTVVKSGCILLLFYVLYKIYQKEKLELRDSILLLAITFAGVGMTMMTLVLFPVLLGILSLIQSIRRKSLLPMLQVIIAVIPIAIETMIFLKAKF